jgi:hypothetical protein
MISLNRNEQLSSDQARSVVYAPADRRIQLALNSRRTTAALSTIAHTLSDVAWQIFQNSERSGQK